MAQQQLGIRGRAHRGGLAAVGFLAYQASAHVPRRPRRNRSRLQVPGAPDVQGPRRAGARTPPASCPATRAPANASCTRWTTTASGWSARTSKVTPHLRGHARARSTRRRAPTRSPPAPAPVTGSDGVPIEHVVRFATVDGVSVGFSAAVDGSTPEPDPTKKTGGIRESRADGDAMWDVRDDRHEGRRRPVGGASFGRASYGAAGRAGARPRARALRPARRRPAAARLRAPERPRACGRPRAPRPRGRAGRLQSLTGAGGRARGRAGPRCGQPRISAPDARGMDAVLPCSGGRRWITADLTKDLPVPCRPRRHTLPRQTSPVPCRTTLAPTERKDLADHVRAVRPRRRRQRRTQARPAARSTAAQRSPTPCSVDLPHLVRRVARPPGG